MGIGGVRGGGRGVRVGEGGRGGEKEVGGGGGRAEAKRRDGGDGRGEGWGGGRGGGLQMVQLSARANRFSVHLSKSRLFRLQWKST